VGHWPQKAESPVPDFDGRVAVLRRDGRDCGYLFVSAGGSPPAFTLEFLRAGGGNTWYYSDRADPDDYDTTAELAAAEIDWYGTSCSARWLPVVQGREISALFDAGRRRRSWLSRRAGRTKDARPEVLPDT
jgi:Zn-dependent M28 family amino/carboxypeptidase